VEVSGLHVLAGVPAGILFKSASTRGGTIQNIDIHDVVLEGVTTAFSVAFNWNPSYSYATMPADVRNPPAYWRVLTEAARPEKGLPHVRGVHVTNLKATGARQAFSVAVENAEGWTFADTHIQTAEGTKIRE
jgi:polygalacturonase